MAKKKNSLMKKVDGFLKRKGQEFKEWRAEAPERREKAHKEKMIRLDQQLKESELQGKLLEKKQKIVNIKTEMQEKRREAMDNIPKMPSLMGSFGDSEEHKKKEKMPSVNEIFGIK